LSTNTTDGTITQIRTLAEQGTTIRTIAEQLGISQSRTYAIIRRLSLEAPWKIRRRIRYEQTQDRKEEQTVNEPNPQHSPTYLANRYLAGGSLREIGSTVGLSGERVRQIIEEGGFSVRQLKAQRRNAEAEKHTELREAVSSWIESHKGCTPEELENEFGVPYGEIYSVLPSRSRKLILIELPEDDTKASGNTQWSPEQRIFALQQAAKIVSPLTKEAYDELKSKKIVQGPVGSRYIQVYGSWTVACAIAGVEPGVSPRQNYQREYSNFDLVSAVAEFMTDSTSLTLAAYDKWRSSRTNLPSGSAIRIKFQGWPVVQRRALELLRSRWANISD